MKKSVVIVAALLALGLGSPMLASADASELGEPIVELMPHVERLETQLGLDAEQTAAIDAWRAHAPGKRKELEARALATRAALRDAILDGDDRLQREALKKELATIQTRLIEMRSLCTRMLRQTLSAEQFAMVVASYRAG